MFLYASNSALAASGGRMGGRSRSSSSRSSSSRGSSSRSASSRSSSSRSSSSRSYSSGGSAYKSYSSSPPSYSSSSLTRSSGGGGDDETLVESVSVGDRTASVTYQKQEDLLSVGSVITTTIFTFVVVVVLMNGFRSHIRKTSIIKLQVCLLGSAQSLQKSLNRIAETADTSTKECFTYILTETSRAILVHADYCISGYSSVNLKSDSDDAEELFNQISIEERGKIDEETLVNVDNKKRKITSSKESTGINNEYIVITILVDAEGIYKLPTINSTEDLKEALEILGSISTNKTEVRIR